MKRKFTFLIAAAFMLLTMMATTGEMWGQEATLSFTSNSWGLPEGSNAGIQGPASYISGNDTITLYASTKFYYNTSDKYLLFGKTNSTLTLPKFSFDVEKIEVVGRNGASGSVKQNIYVGNNAVSTETTGATGTNTYMISSNYQTAGNVYVLKVTSNHNTQVTSIKIYKKQETSVATPTFSPEGGTYTEAQTVTISCDTQNVDIYYTTDGSTPDDESTQYNGSITVSESMTIKAIAYDSDDNASSVATAVYTIQQPLSTMDEIFAAATAAGNTATTVIINFDNWVVTGVKNKNAYVTDGTKGFIIYQDGHGFSVGDVLSGTATCKVQLYNGSSEITTLTATTTGLTVTSGGAVTPATNISIADLTGVNTGAVLSYDNLTYNGTALVDANDNTITPYNTLYSYTFVNGKSYNVKGIYLQYNSTKELLPRSADDIEVVDTEVADPVFSPVAGTYATTQTVTMSCTTEGAAIHYTTDGTEPDGNSNVYSTGITVSETTTFKAKAIKGDDTSAVITATYHICSAENPYTVAQALAFLEYPTSTIWVHGIVSTAPTSAPNSDGQLTYYISDNGETTNQLQVYKGKGLNNAAFTAQDDIQVGDIVTITGTVKIYNSIKEFDAGNYLTSFERPVEPSITVANSTVNVDAEGGEGTLTVTYENITDIAAEVWFCNAAGTDDATYDWITAEINNTTNNVEYLVEPNDGDERTAYFKVWAYDDEMNEVYSNLVTITQAEYVAPTPSIAVDPTLVEAPAAGTDGTINVTLTAIADDDIEVQWFESDGTTPATSDPDWIVAVVDPNKDIAYSIEENTGDARSAYFKVYGIDSEANDVYSELVTINQAAGGSPATSYTWDLSIASYDEITDPDIVTWSSNYATMTNSSKSGGTSASNYLGGDSNNRTSSRFYNGNTLTITPANGYAITSVVFTATSTSYASTLSNSSWTNATATVDSQTVTVTPTDGTTAISASIGGTCGFTAVTVSYVENNAPSITVAPATLNLKCDGGDGELTVTHKNLADDPQLAVIFVESDGETTTTCNWIQASINAAGNVAGHIDANTGEARTAYLKVTGRDADNHLIKSNLVTFNQAAAAEPSIVFSEPTLDIIAGGENRTMSFDYEGLGQNPTFSINFYESDGTTSATYDWCNAELVSGDNKVNITVSANEGAARSAYFKVSGVNGEINALSNLVTINQAANVPTTTYTLATTIEPGYHYIIAGNNKGEWFAMGTQNNNNRAAVSITVNNNVASVTSNDVHEFVISGDSNNNYTIYDENDNTTGYLYAASSSSNYLKTRSNNNDGNSQWAISFNEGVASIVAQGNSSKNVMQFNSGSSIFACYGSASQSAVYLYKKDNDSNPVYYSPTQIAAANPNPTTTPIIVVNNEILVLSGDLSNCNNPDNLVIEDGGQLVFDGTGVKATMKKKTVGESKAGHWYTIASPVKNIDFANITNLTNAATFDLYRYNEATYTWENYKNPTHSDFVTAENGRGYLYYNSDGNELSFAGELNNSVSYNLTAFGAQMNGLNLIGNPFTQDITLANISLSDDAQISEGFYVLSNNSDWVASVNTVKPCEGFIVKVDKATTATFSKSTGSSKSRANRDYIAFTVANNQYEDVAYAMFSNGLGLDKIDHRNAEIPMVYIPQNGQDYAIATMSDDTEMFNLNFKAKTTGQYTLKMNANSEYSYLHVIDRFTGEDIDMLLDGEYSFIGSPRDDENRFVVKLNANSNFNTGNDIFAYQNGNEIIVNGEGELQIFDVMGRFVMSRTINGDASINTAAFNTGVYLFRIVGTEVKTQKIVVR